MEGYQIKGTAEYVTEGLIVDTFMEMAEAMFKRNLTVRKLFSKI